MVYCRTFQIIYFAVPYFAIGDASLVSPQQTQFSLFQGNSVSLTYSVLPLKAIQPHTRYTNTADNVGNLDKQSTNSFGMQRQLLFCIQLSTLHIHIKYYFIYNSGWAKCSFCFFSLTIRCT